MESSRESTGFITLNGQGVTRGEGVIRGGGVIRGQGVIRVFTPDGVIRVIFLKGLRRAASSLVV